VNADFTVKIYKQFLKALKEEGFSFQTYYDFIKHPQEKVIILRHDVDARNEHSLQFAKIQHEMAIVGTYYFRMVPQSFDKEVIREISSMGHEIGYHYEDMDLANGDIEQAYELAKKHLSKHREVAEVKTICMHGSPRSPYDNKEVWRKYDYRDLGIIAEPYFDLDFTEVFYLTDTGRRWDGHKVSIRDKVANKQKKDWPVYHSTYDIIEAIENGTFPDKVMMNFHPQRWTDDYWLWTQELISQNAKNVIKLLINKFRD